MNSRAFSIGFLVVTGLVVGLTLFGVHKKNPYDISSLQLSAYNGNLCAVAIIGSGPAGCAAAIYTPRLALPTVVFGGKIPGGQLTRTGIVENVPGAPNTEGFELMQIMRDQAESFGAIFMDKKIINVDTSSWPYVLHFEDGGIFHALSIIIASGSTPKTLGCPGEEEYWGRGVTTCAICDAALHPGKEVIVVGGGDTACEEAILLAPYASKIYILVRSGKMRASQIMRQRVESIEKIEILYNTSIKEIMGDGKKVQSVSIERSGKRSTLNVSGVFVAIGHTPNTEFVRDVVEMDENGLIKCHGSTQKTTIPGILAAGDVENNYKQAAVAIGNGVKASLDAHKFLQDSGLTDTLINQNKRAFFRTVEANESEDKIVSKESNSTSINEATDDESLLRSTQSHDDNEIHELKSIQEFLEVTKQRKNIIVDVHTDACSACKRLKKVIERYIKENVYSKDFIPVYSINAGSVRGAIEYFGISSVPLLLLYSQGEKKFQNLGYLDERDFAQWIKFGRV